MGSPLIRQDAFAQISIFYNYPIKKAWHGMCLFLVPTHILNSWRDIYIVMLNIGCDI
jgi:hypothetical protein